MVATLLELRDEVKLLLNNDVDFFTDATLDTHINTAYVFHHGIVSDAFQNRLVIEDFIDTFSGTQSYALSLVKNSGRLPDQVVNVKYLGSDISSVNYLDLTYQDQTRTDDISTRGIPQSYEIVGNDIILGIPPDATLIDGLKIRFVPYPTELVADGDAIESAFDGLGKKCITHYSVLIAKAQEEAWEPGSAGVQGFKVTYEDLVLRFKNNLEMRAFEEDEVQSFINDDVNY